MKHAIEPLLALREAGLPTESIAKRLGVGPRTIRRWLAEGHGPSMEPRKPRRSPLDWSTRYLRERWEAGQRNGTVLWEELKAASATVDRIVVSIGVWLNGAISHVHVEAWLRLAQFLARPWKT